MDVALEVLEQAQLIDLVRAAQQGEREAFGELYERFSRHVYAIGFARLRNHAEAEELVQEVFVQALLKIEQLRAPEAFAGWLRSIAQRMAINRAVRRPPDMATEPEAMNGYCVEERTPLDFALAGEANACLHEQLDELGELDRRTLEAFYLSGHSLLEMSDEFDAPLGTIKRRLHVARKRLARQLDPLLCV